MRPLTWMMNDEPTILAMGSQPLKPSRYIPIVKVGKGRLPRHVVQKYYSRLLLVLVYTRLELP